MFVCALFPVAVFSGACSSSGGVDMRGHEFAPETITVRAGETVTWSNSTDEVHTVTAFDDGVPEGAEYFASGGAPNEDAARDALSAGLMESGDEFSHTFEQPGTYEYFCIPHEDDGMTGTVVVEERE
jgi:plastocyanin